MTRTSISYTSNHPTSCRGACQLFIFAIASSLFAVHSLLVLLLVSATCILSIAEEVGVTTIGGANVVGGDSQQPPFEGAVSLSKSKYHHGHHHSRATPRYHRINRSLQPFHHQHYMNTTSTVAAIKSSVAGANLSAVVSDQVIQRKKVRLRQYLKSLRNKQTKRVILGQQGNHEDTDLSSSYASGFDFVYDELADFFNSERHVGYIGVDIGELGYSPTEFALQDILRFGLSGHIVTAVFCPRNPWTGGDSWDRRDVNITDILPRGSRRPQWLAYLNTIADVLQEASNQGIIVLIRYLQEMNGDWFWWCNLSKAHFKALYRDIHRHFTNRRGLKNLLHIYSPNNKYDTSVKPYRFYFPGKRFVDIVGVDVYEDCFDNKPFEIYEYSSLVSLAGNKPVIIAEIGPQSEDTLFWYWNYADAFGLYPEVVMALAWNDWSYEGDGNWIMKSIRGNHPDGVLWHETVIAKEELPASLFANTL